jgi:hypothetical protein
VAVAWTLGFAWAAHIRLPLWAPVLLGLVGWAVYMGDRLLDAYAGTSSPPRHQLRERHYFHWRHRRVFASLAIGSAAVATWIVVALVPARAIKPDTVAAAAALAYFSTVHFRLTLPTALGRLLHPVKSREFIVGTLFTTACVLPVWSQVRQSLGLAATDWLLITPFISFAVLAWLNCRAIGIWESDPNAFLPDRMLPLARRIGLAGLVLAGILAFAHPRPAALLAAGAISALLLGVLDRMRHHITPLALRSAADLVLLTPLLLLPLANRA